jgi:tetratricopeptide (TPR) repeat protein
LRIGDLTQAYRLYLAAAREDASVPDVWLCLGKALSAFGKNELALTCFRKALVLRQEAEELFCMGKALGECAQLDEAESHFTRGLALKPNELDGLYGLLYVYLTRGQLQKAQATLERVVAIEPGSPRVRWSTAILHLMRGDYVRGFGEFDARLEIDHRILRPSEPLWRGEDLRGKTLHVLSEQGFGDTIQFSRFIHSLAHIDVVFMVPTELRRLFETSFARPGLRFYNHGTPSFFADYSIHLCSIPKHFGLHDMSLRAYLRPPRVSRVVHRPRGTRLAVGFCWAGNPKNVHDKLRSATPDVFVEALALPGVELYALQVGADSIDSALVGDAGLAQNLSPLIRDFGDTAALIAQLDVVVSVDTAVAHLAGAMGKPCHILIPYGAVDWRWMHGRSESPWYPSVTLHRQLCGESWAGVLHRVADMMMAQLGPRTNISDGVHLG